MTQKEITEGNKLIGWFDEKYKAANQITKGVMTDETWNQYLSERGWYDYHKSWDWLMPVVEKIEKIGYWTTIHSRYTIIGTMGQDDCIVNKSGERIEATWLAVVEFIKWHNQQK